MSIVAALKICRRVEGAFAVEELAMMKGGGRDRQAVHRWCDGSPLPLPVSLPPTHRPAGAPTVRGQVSSSRAVFRPREAARRWCCHNAPAHALNLCLAAIRTTDAAMLGSECRGRFPCGANVVMACNRPGGGDVLIHLGAGPARPRWGPTESVRAARAARNARHEGGPHRRQSSLSSVIGRSRMRLPVALNTALATAAATPVMPISPMPRAPSGDRGSGIPVHITSISGTSR